MSARRENIERVREQAGKEPLGVDISDYSDEFCAGFLAGQVNALDQVAAVNQALNHENADLNSENRNLLEKWSERGAALERTERERDTALRGREFFVTEGIRVLERAEKAERALAEMREALERLCSFDFHATQHIDGLTHDGHALRAIHVEDVDAIIAAQEVARAALRPSEDTSDER